MIGRIVRPADFQRVLAAPQRSRSAHFAVHHLDGVPLRAAAQRSSPVFPGLSPELSTDDGVVGPKAVDDCRLWLGLVVPKRHAKRAVTRTLVKRQIRSAVGARVASLPPGLWVVRLKAPFERQQFPSAASQALRDAAHAELAQLIERAINEALPARRATGRPAAEPKPSR